MSSMLIGNSRIRDSRKQALLNRSFALGIRDLDQPNKQLMTRNLLHNSFVKLCREVVISNDVSKLISKTSANNLLISQTYQVFEMSLCMGLQELPDASRAPCLPFMDFIHGPCSLPDTNLQQNHT